MEIIDKATYTSTRFNVEHNGKEYYVTYAENDLYDDWEVIDSDDDPIDDELVNALIDFCDENMVTKESTETWKQIEEEYTKDNYPPFGGPFTDAVTQWEWLEKHYNVPKIK